MKPILVSPQEEHQRAVYGSGQRGHGAVRLHRRAGGQLPARPATGHQHEEDLHHGGGGCQEEEPVYPGQTPSGRWMRRGLSTETSLGLLS